ncbi:MAG: GNAT family N-acetyltransferase [Pseudomonadales bacterium]|nr:N-acetyltransferase [Pseudomonadales bacterium]NIX09695.1 GNAT family N-acetyltransferase [Pseudomonadales bacterium]
MTDVRRAGHDDLPAIVGIYNHYVAHSHCTFDIETYSVDERWAWWQQFDAARYQCWVAEHAGRVIGYACSQPLKAKGGYEPSVEVSVYLDAAHTGRGAGRSLCEHLLEALAPEDVHRAYALIALPNDPSIALHRKLGFREVAHLSEVGRKFDRFWDVVWLERAF